MTTSPREPHSPNFAFLTKHDAVLVRHAALVDETASARRHRAPARTTKNGSGRTLPLRDELLELFTSLPRTSDGYVFHGPKGGRLKPDLARRRLISEVLEPLKAQFPTSEDERGFADGRLHSFRHFFCSLCANQGVPEQTVMTWLGHRNSAMVRHDESAV